MEFKTYKVKQGQYGGIINSTVTLPSNTKFITGGTRDIGPFINDGLSHYIGVVEGDYNEIANGCKGLSVNVYEFPDFNIITVHNVLFMEEIDIVSAETLNSLYNFSNYYIVHYSENLVITSMFNVQFIKSEFKIKTNCVYNSSWLYDQKPLRIIETEVKELCKLYPRYSSHCIAKVVKGDIAKKYWNTLVYQVLNEFDVLFFEQEKANINLAYELGKARKHNELADVLNMKICELIK